MNLVQKILTIYPQLDKAELLESGVIVQDDGEGPYIKQWNHPVLPEPTQAELDAITGDYVPDLGAVYDKALQNNQLIRALVKALNKGTFVPGSNYTGPQMKTIIKAEM